jgi:hypothetical protein
MRLLLGSLFFLVMACGSADEGSVAENTGTTAEASKKKVCASCGVKIHPDIGSACGEAICTTGEYCCNASRGICAPLGAACPTVFVP